jgi:hypothetical protein
MISENLAASFARWKTSDLRKKRMCIYIDTQKPIINRTYSLQWLTNRCNNWTLCIISLTQAALLCFMAHWTKSPIVWLLCNWLEAVTTSIYSLICHQSTLTPLQASPDPSRPFHTSLHVYISCSCAPLTQFYRIDQVCIFFSITSLWQVSNFHLDSLLVSCILKLQSHSFGFRQLSVHLLHRFDSSNIVLDQLISRPRSELVYLSFPALSLLNSWFNIIVWDLRNSLSHQL